MAGGFRAVAPSASSEVMERAAPAGEDMAFPAVQICAATSSTDSAPLKRDPGVPTMSPEALRECCKKSNGWENPELNDVLMLHYKGFRKIENLDQYKNAKSLFLESNGIARIENLEVMPDIRTLYLQQNCIPRLENLCALTQLQVLNLSHNSISVVENLAELRCLETLNLASNKFMDVEALRGLAERPTLKSVDVSYNYFEEGDPLINIWSEVSPKIECLYLHHNPCSRGLKDYRRRAVSSLSQLRWLDERPVDKAERAGCEAWAVGGKDAELKAKQGLWWAEKNAKEASFNTHRKVQQAYAERAKLQREQAEAKGLQVGGSALSSVQLRDTSGESFREAAAATEEKEAAIRSKVQAFLASKRPPTSDESARATSVGSEEVPDSAGDSVEEEEPEVEEVVTEESAVEAPDVPWEWSSFKDRRLGRLVPEMKVDYAKVAVAMSHEFDCTVDADACTKDIGNSFAPA